MNIAENQRSQDKTKRFQPYFATLSGEVAQQELTNITFLMVIQWPLRHHSYQHPYVKHEVIVTFHMFSSNEGYITNSIYRLSSVVCLTVLFYKGILYK
jgi:hypothetical protein